METVLELQQAWFTYLRKESTVKRKELVERLKTLREEFGDHVLSSGMAAPVAMIFNDVCQALDLTEEERQEVLGQEVARAVDQWVDCRVWVLTKKSNGSQIVQRVDRQAPVAETLVSHFVKEARRQQAQKDLEDLFGKEET